MKNLEYTFIGWCYDEEKNHDKVWACMKISGGNYDGKYLTAWGRRGYKLSTKIYDDITYYDMETVVRKKRKKYDEIDETKLDTVYSDFEKDLSKKSFWAMMTT